MRLPNLGRGGPAWPVPPDQTPTGPDVPGRAGGSPPYVSELCRAGEHARCRHPANTLRADGCECACHAAQAAVLAAVREAAAEGLATARAAEDEAAASGGDDA